MNGINIEMEIGMEESMEGGGSKDFVSQTVDGSFQLLAFLFLLPRTMKDRLKGPLLQGTMAREIGK